MKLHYAPGTISISVAITLHEMGIDYEPVRVDFASGEQTKAPYHEVNPKGRVPTLETPDGILTETGAILDYLNAIKPEAALVPEDPFQAGRMRELMCYLASTMHVNHAHKMRGPRWANTQASFDDMAAKVPETMTAGAAHVEAYYPLDPFVLGRDVTLADAYLFVVANWLPGDGVDMSGFPRLSRFMETMGQRASVARARDLGMI
ncbi:MAG: glutathione S-transferase family protein [Arenibacterium sp.]